MRLTTAYEHFLNIASFGRGIEWPINGVPFRIDARYRRNMAQSYDSAFAATVRAMVKRGDTCWDVGANVGVYVLQLANWTSPGGRIVAFEPNPATVAALNKHVQINGLRERVTVVPAAVGEAQGTATLYAEECDGMSRLGNPNRLLPRTRPIQVPVVSLDDYAAKTRTAPDFLMIDVEGFEFSALAGARRLLSENRQICIIVEMHPDVWPSVDMNKQKAEALLNELRLKPIPLTGQGDILNEYGQIQLLQDERSGSESI